MGGSYTPITTVNILKASDLVIDQDIDLGSYNLSTTGTITTTNTITGSNIKDLKFIRWGYNGFDSKRFTITESEIIDSISSNYGTMSEGTTVLTSATDDFFQETYYRYLPYVFGNFKETSASSVDWYLTKTSNGNNASNVCTKLTRDASTYATLQGRPYNNLYFDYGETAYFRFYGADGSNVVYCNYLYFDFIKTFINPFTLSDYSSYISEIIGISLYDNGDVVKINDSDYYYYTGVSGNPINIELPSTITKIEIISGNPLLICKV